MCWLTTRAYSIGTYSVGYEVAFAPQLTDAVMLSAAKHLQFSPSPNQMQILRFAQNDM
jgi:hypothetical protein